MRASAPCCTTPPRHRTAISKGAVGAGTHLVHPHSGLLHGLGCPPLRSIYLLLQLLQHLGVGERAELIPLCMPRAGGGKIHPAHKPLHAVHTCFWSPITFSSALVARCRSSRSFTSSSTACTLRTAPRVTGRERRRQPARHNGHERADKRGARRAARAACTRQATPAWPRPCPRSARRSREAPTCLLPAEWMCGCPGLRDDAVWMRDNSQSLDQ